MSLPSFLPFSTWKVVASPVVRVGVALLVGGAVAASAAPASRPTPLPNGYRLALATESAPNCYYGSAWNDGDVVLPHDASDGKAVTITSRYEFEDGCTWEATERLTPQGSGYAYEYVEHYVSCEDGAKPASACARRGAVSVSPNF
jgi:hypothetical protein